MGLQVEINEIADISNRELIKGIEAMQPEDYYWLKDRFNLMKTFREQVWHFKTSAFMLSKRELEDFEMLDLLKECNKIQNSLLKKLRKTPII
jgi:hypothetical protein